MNLFIVCVIIYSMWVKDKITLFTYTLPYHIGVILRTPTQNNSYILWENMCLFSVPLHYGVFP